MFNFVFLVVIRDGVVIKTNNISSTLPSPFQTLCPRPCAAWKQRLGLMLGAGLIPTGQPMAHGCLGDRGPWRPGSLRVIIHNVS